MVDLELYSHSLYFDPISVIANIWAALTRVDNILEFESSYSWNSGGLLPCIRFGHRVIPREHIIDFLKIVVDVDYDISSSEKLKGYFI